MEAGTKSYSYDKGDTNMCYDDNARPPIPPGAGGTAQGEDIVLTAADGNRFAAYAAQPGSPTGKQIHIFPDVRGLHQFYKELALRFAEVGVSAVAIDYFGRSAGLTSRDDSFDFMPHVQQLQLDTFFADVAAALAHMRTGAGADRATFTVGFCMGGTLSFISGTQDFGFAGVIGFYAGMSRNMSGRGTLLDHAPHIRYPVLGLFGGAYEGAPHSFFDRRATEFAEASADSWQRVLGFIQAHTAKQPVKQA